MHQKISQKKCVCRTSCNMLYHSIFTVFSDRVLLHENDQVAQELVNSFQVLEVLAPAIHDSLHSQVSWYTFTLSWI